LQQTIVDNRYALSELLAGAGMSKVDLAHDRLLERAVALKVLRELYAESGEFFDRFERKAKAAACLAAPMPALVPALGESPGRVRRNQAVRRERLL
jgi:eukaryotic-like serine/threonine-protein kinase